MYSCKPTVKVHLPDNKKIYFASDLHLMPGKESLERERLFVRWLDAISGDAAAVYLLGDIFDFWFEYKHVVPRGFTRLLAKIGQLVEDGIPVYYITGNHDMWMRDYLSSELGITIYRHPVEITINNKIFFLGHGHGMGPTGIKDKILLKLFSSFFLQKLYATIHPRWGMAFGQMWSKNSRKRHGWALPFEDIEKENIVVFVRKILKNRHIDFFILGHRHLALDIPLSENSRYINTGEWVKKPTYAVFDGSDVSLHAFQ